MKWKWRIVNDKCAIWRGLINHRYKNPEGKMFISDKSVISHGDSIWWRDLILVDSLEFDNCNCFSGNTLCRVKDGKSTTFWFSRWAGNQTLKEAFHESFVVAAEPFYSVADVGQWEHGHWSWYTQDLRLFTNEGVNWLGEILQDWIPDNIFVQDVADVFDWIPEKDHFFSIYSAYVDLMSRF